MDGGAGYLSRHYSRLGDQQSDFRNTNLHGLILSRIRGKSVLDIGAGSGALLAALQRRGMQCFGLEPNPELIKLSRTLYPELTIRHGTSEDVHRFNRRFDAVTLIDVLEHIEQDRLSLQKIHQSLEVGGVLVIVVPAFPVLYGMRDRNNGHYRRYRKKELIEKLASAGFAIKEVRYWNALGFIPYFVAEKILHRELNTDLRAAKPKSPIKRLLAGALKGWFQNVENRVDFGFGLSLFCLAEKTNLSV
jgi:2-polyprenyl-3-methyl-5-hydroxy-6-metoxy-1,4-benzoquinol methylase